MAPNIQFKRGTAATFHTLNPVLLKGEPGLETDTSKIKFGDGVTAWRDLPYANPDLETLDGGEEMLPPVPSAPGSFSPPDVDGLTLWMDATHGDYIHKVDNKVSVWEDMSPERVRFVQSLKASRPLVSSQIEAQDVVTFDGSNDAMISNFQVPEEFTLLVAFRRNGVRAEARVVTAVDSEGENEVVLLGTDSGASFGASVGGSYSALQPVDDMVAVVYALRSTAEGFATRLNGLNQQVGDSPIPVGSERICMGSSRANFSTGAFSGDVAEVVMYDSYLSDADLKDVEEYMMARWGVVAVQHPLLEGMKAFWPLNEEGGDRFDITDAEVPLSPTGTVGFAPGVIENAAEFTGGNNYLQAPTDFSLSGSFSISLWFKASVMSGGRSALVQNWAAGNASGQVELGFGDEGSDSSAVFARIATDEDIYSVVVPNFEANLWFHVAMVYSSDDNTLTLYCDGQQAAQVATLGNFNAGNIPFRVGISDQTSTQNDLSFLADQIGFWERALGTNEVQMLYNYELGKEDFAADFYGDEVSLLLHMDKPANAVGESGGGGGGGGGGPTIDPDFDKVSLLLKMDGANGSTTFTDSSPNTLTVTANGNASISTAQSKFGGASGYFDGTSASKLVISEDANFGENDFTIEAWVWIDVNTCNTDGPCICEIGSHSQGLSAFGSDGLIFMVGFRSGNWIAWGWIGPDQGSGALPYTSEPITPGQWTHLAMTRQNGVFRLFVDGVKGAEDTRYVNIIGSDNSIQIGGSLNGSATNSFGGYIDDLRITKGLARYTADFAPPTASHPLGYTKVVTMPTVETSLLLHFDGADGSTTFSDSGQNARTVTANGGAVISNAQSKFGGTSAYFAGTPATGSSQLSIPTNTNFGTADFTVEAWIWIDENTTAAGWSDGPGIVELGSHSALGNDGIIFMTGLRSGSWIAWAWCNPFGGGIPFTSNTITPGQWTHVAWTRQGNVFRIFIDGIKGTEYTSSASIPASDNSIQIGGSLNGATANAFGGYIDEVRVIKGAALYTDNFTPPALPFPNPPAGPALLLHFDGSNGSATFTDSSPLNAAINPWGNPVISTAQSKFGGSSLYLDGNSYLRTNDAPAFELRTGDFTVEAWINTSSSSEQTILSMWDCNQAQFLMKVSNYQAMILWATDQPIPPETYYGGTITPGEWTHLAFTRAGSVGRVFLNGIEVINFTATDSFQPATTAIQIGKEANCYSANWFIGYIDEFRVTKGQALYTANFTPPTAPFPNPGAQPAPDLLLHFDGTDGSTTFADSGKNQLAVTRSGNAAISTTQSRFGGSSVYFGGAGNGLTVEESSAVRIGSADFTIEFWVYNSGAGQHFIGRHITGVGANWLIGIVGGNLYWEPGTAGTATFSSQPVPSNEWAHIAVTRSSGVSRSFINGVLVATGNASGSLDDSILCPLTIGADSTFANAMTGYIDELRIVKGRAIYTEDFNPPAGPFLNPTVTLVPPPGVDPHINNVSLLLHMDGENNGTTFVDSSPNALAVVATGDAVVSTGEIKFGSASGYFNGGSNSFLTVPASANFAYGTDDFTIECWVNSADLSSWHVIYSQSISGNNYCVLGAENGQVQFLFNYSNPGAYVYGGTITAGTWHHIAVCRKEGVATVYVDGVGGTPAACTFDFANTTFTPQVGSYGHNTSYNFDGYIDELRVTKGVARYTGDFTPPTAAFPSATSGGGGNGPITTFIDTSKHNHEVTAAGSAYLNLTDIKYGNASGEFAGGHCEIAMSPEFAFDNGDFTVEFWGKLSYVEYSAVFSTASTAQEAGTYLIGFSDDTNMFGFCHDIEAFVFCAANIAEYYNTWTHYAFVRASGVLKMYINGAEVATSNASSNLDGGTATTAVIGRRWTNQDDYYLDGLIDDLRITKGVARYIAEFNPPSKAFPDPIIPVVSPPNNGDPYAEYVTLLLHMDGANGSTVFTDNSYLQNTVTANGNAAISTAQSKFGGASGYFGSGGYILTSVDLDPDADFTIEAWVYMEDGLGYQTIFGFADNYLVCYFAEVDGSIINFINGSGGGASGGTIPIGQWFHLACVRNNGINTLYINGSSVATSEQTFPINTNDFAVGESILYGDPLHGYIDDLRITKGVARYTANFTPPTVPFPNPFVPGPVSSLLLHFDGPNGSTTFTNAANTAQTLTHEGDVVISTAQSKFGGGSLYQPQSGGSVMVPYSPTMDLGTGDFTIEFWYYPLSLFALGSAVIQGGGNPGEPGGDWCNPVNTLNVSINDYGTTFGLGRNCNPFDASATIALTTNEWHHLAVTRQGSTVYFFQNGVLMGTGTSTQNYLTQQTYGMRICDPLLSTQQYGAQYGVSIDGYLDEVRIVKGQAVYTANFTPPTTPFSAASDVKPTDVTGCDLWLDSTGDIGEVNGTIVTWADKSGNGRTATPADYAPAPFVAVGEGPNGQNVVRFSGDPNVLDIGYQFNLKNSSGFVVVGQTVAPEDCSTSRPERILSFQPANGLDWQQNDAMVLHHNQNNGGSGSHAVDLYNTGTAVPHSVNCPMEWTVFSYVIDGAGNVRFRRNGVDEETAMFSSLTNKAGAELLLGFGGDFTQASALRGDIAEVVIFDHALGDAALVALERGIVARCLPPPSPPTYELFDGLVGYWPLNGDANDYTANNYDLTGDGPSGFGNGRINGGLVCSGAGGYYYPSNALFNTYGNNYSVTVNLWFKTNATDGTIEGGRPHLISTVPEAPPYWGWRLCWENNSFFAGLNGEGGGVALFADGLYCDGQWHMVTLVIDTATHMAEFWIDGQKKDESAFVGEIGGQYAKLTVGYREGLFNGYFYGSIDEVGIWGRSLDGVEIAELYDGGAGLDPIPPSSLLLHFDGETFTDSSVNGLAVTANGGAVISAAQSVFGGASLHLPAKGDYLSVQSSEGFNFGDGDFTIEFWLYLENNSDGGVIVYTNNSSSVGWGVWIRWENDTWNMVFDVPGIIAFVYPISMTTGGWHHLAFARQGSQLMMFNDGTQAAAVGFNYTVSGGTDEIVVGYPASAAGPSGYIDELRIVKGVALYTSNFTPPTGPYNS